MHEAAQQFAPDFRKRAKKELADLGASQLDLAKSSAIPYGRLQHLLSGTRQPRPFEIEAIRQGFKMLEDRG